MHLFDVDWGIFGTLLLRIAVAYLLALPIGWERERADSSAGIRTFPLVASASCGFVLIAVQAFPGGADASARIIQGVITGMGFIGGGAILRHGGTVSGTATAASIWNMGAIGTAVALGRLDIALILSGLNILTLRVLLPLKARIDRRSQR